jgi:hypothetical protein
LSVAVIFLPFPPKGLAELVFVTDEVSATFILPEELELPKALAGTVIFTPVPPVAVSSITPPLAGVIGLFFVLLFQFGSDSRAIFFPQYLVYKINRFFISKNKHK